jgi:uncharacterized protein
MLHDLVFFFTGLLVGAMNAVSGGGMLIGFPIMLSLGMTPLVANITANVAVLPGNIGAAVSYRKYLKKVPRVYLLLLIPAIVGAAVGAILLRHTSFTSFNHIIPWLILFAVVLFALQPFIYMQIQKHLHGPKNKRNSFRPLLLVGLAVLPLSVYGGYFGAGFGFIMLAFLGFTKLHEHMHRMNALRTVITVFIAGVSIICLFTSHLIDWQHGLIMGAGCLLGGYYGAIAIQRVSSHTLRIMVIALGLTTATYLGLRTY